VIGKGGHGAAPELTIDPVVIASHIIIALQQIISRNAGPKQPTVLTFGKIIAEGATNIIPDEVKISEHSGPSMKNGARRACEKLKRWPKVLLKAWAENAK